MSVSLGAVLYPDRTNIGGPWNCNSSAPAYLSAAWSATRFEVRAVKSHREGVGHVDRNLFWWICILQGEDISGVVKKNRHQIVYKYSLVETNMRDIAR